MDVRIILLVIFLPAFVMLVFSIMQKSRETLIK